MKVVILILTMSLLGCAGEFDMSTDGVSMPSGWSPPSSTNPNDPEAETVTEDLTPGFALERDEVRLLPFHIRMEKLTRVTGLTAQDPLFDALWAKRYELGDHNFGQGIGPDLSWNASKIAIWVRALRPVCASEVIATRFNLPQDTAGLMAAAYGRDPAPEEVDELAAAVAGQALDEAGAYEATCLGVLTTAEFVAQ